jgi:hypothetical protein
VRRVVRLPDGGAIAHRPDAGGIVFPAGRLETLAMFALETQ